MAAFPVGAAGTIRQGSSFAGKSLESVPETDIKPSSLAKQATFASPALLAGKARRLPRPTGEIALASHDEQIDRSTSTSEETSNEGLRVPGEQKAPQVRTTPNEIRVITSPMPEDMIELPTAPQNDAQESGWFYSVDPETSLPRSRREQHIINPQIDCPVPLPQPIIDTTE